MDVIDIPSPPQTHTYLLPSQAWYNSLGVNEYPKSTSV